MTEIEALVGLNLVADIGSIRLKKLLAVFGSPRDILEAPRDQLLRVGGIGETIASRIAGLDRKAVYRELSAAEKKKISILIPGSEDYPSNLKFIIDPPIVLYLKGKLLPEDNLALAIVGSRRASLYGLNCARRFAQELAGRGLTVISGLARGVDTAAHKGALRSGGRTIAVIGNGLADIYPRENQELAERIAENGAVVSEFPLACRPLKQNFPRRNRVISGLSLGVLVAEAARNSGALITADFALEQGREVFVVPGKIDGQESFGSNSLIQQGGKLVRGADDILEEFPFCRGENKRVDARPGEEAGLKQQGLSCAEERLYNIISSHPVSVDECVQKTGLGFGAVCKALLGLQLKRKIRELAGKIFERNNNG